MREPSPERYRRMAKLEVRAKGRKLLGYAALFDREALLYQEYEVIRPGAFKDALEQRDVLALVDHDASKLLARTKSGTLRLAEDKKGLAFSLDVPDTQTGQDVLTLAERGDVGGMSFGFSVPEGGERRHEPNHGPAGALRLRELIKIDLYEISVVLAWPAYDGTEVNYRSTYFKIVPWRLRLAARHIQMLEQL